MQFDYRRAVEYVERHAQVGCGPISGLDYFAWGVPPGMVLYLQDLCVELGENGIYTLLDWDGKYYEFVDDTQEYSLEEALDKYILELRSKHA